jgi:hypothetical protein
MKQHNPNADISSFENSLRIPDEDQHIIEFRKVIQSVKKLVTEKEATAMEWHGAPKPLRCIDLAGPSPHTPTPCTPRNRLLIQDLIARAERGETTRYSSFAEAGASQGTYCPDLDNPDTWWSDEEAREYFQCEGKRHVDTLVRYQETKMLHYLMQEKLKEVMALKDRLMKRGSK